VADTNNHLIRRIVITSAVVTTVAGVGSVGSLDGIGSAAYFNAPSGLTTDGYGLYVADQSNNEIRLIR
jgi:hypothetical protein